MLHSRANAYVTMVFTRLMRRGGWPLVKYAEVRSGFTVDSIESAVSS